MRLAWVGISLVLVCAIAGAGEGKEKKKDKQNNAASAAGDTLQAEKDTDKAANKAEKAAAKEERKAEKAANKAENEAAKAEREAIEAKEAGGDESELATVAQLLSLSDTQKKEIGKEFEKYRSRLLEIKGLPDSTPNERLLKGPQRRALREDLVKWVSAHVSPGQAQKFEAYEKKRTRDLYEEHVTNRVTKLTQAANLNENQQAKVRTIYNVQLGGIQNAADALYAASQKAGASVADLEKSLEDKRESMKRAVEGVLRPEQLEKYKGMDD